MNFKQIFQPPIRSRGDLSRLLVAPLDATIVASLISNNRLHTLELIVKSSIPPKRIIHQIKAEIANYELHTSCRSIIRKQLASYPYIPSNLELFRCHNYLFTPPNYLHYRFDWKLMKQQQWQTPWKAIALWRVSTLPSFVNITILNSNTFVTQCRAKEFIICLKHWEASAGWGHCESVR